jgi:ABC-2 type transport system ATP-binding protein
VEPIVECQGLRKRYGDRLAVDDVGFAITAGECYGLLGPNGAGKTTTVSMLCGLARGDAGSVTIAGHSLDHEAADAKAALGYVPQEIALYPDLTGNENLRFFGRLYGLSGTDLDQRVARALSVVGLSERAHERVEHYSGGMKRRVNIAAGLLHDPQVLVLDEPTVGVDPQSRHSILTTVEELAAGGLAVLYTTHYMEEAQRLCDRIGILDEGHLIAEGTHAELVARIGEPDRIRLTASGPLAKLDAECRALPDVAEVAASDGQLDVLTGAAAPLLPSIIGAAGRVGVTISRVEIIEPDLEAVFLRLTGKALRD